MKAVRDLAGRQYEKNIGDGWQTKGYKMSWHYQVRRQISEDGDAWFDIVEMYGAPYGHTCFGIRPGGTTKAALIQDLAHMLADAKRYRVIVKER